MAGLFKDNLDVLLTQAKAEASRRRVRALPSKDRRLDAIKEAFNTTYTNPENWQRTRGIALIHRSACGTLTLLGNFSELMHKRNTKVRKLVRENEPIAISAEEIVTGDWWIRKETAEAIASRDHFETRQITFDLELDELQVYAKDAAIRIHLKNNHIARVELTEQTKFICPTNRIFVYFPADLDVLEGMSFTNKIALRQRLGV